ncbi:putative reverse transcriptase domain-containing protein [Tanacetum coccineum]
MEVEEDEDTEVEDNDDENDAEIIHPYEEVDPLNRPPPSPETAEREFMNAPISQSTLQPIPPIRQFTGTFYVGEGSSATVFNPALCKVYPLDLWFRVEGSSFERLRRDMRMDSFDDDLTALDSTLREQIQEMKKLMAELNKQFQQIQERDLRAKNEMLRIRLRAAKERAEYKHMEAEYYKNHWARVSWYFDDLSGWEYRLRNQLPLKRRYRETPYDPSTNTTSRPRCDDPYVMVRDNAVHADAASDRGGETVDTTAVVKDVGKEKDNEGDDAVAAKDTQPSESRGSPLLDGIEAAIRAEQERVREEETKAGGPAGGPVARECTFTRFIKCGPKQFHGTEGAVGLCRWFEKMESTFGISECAERRKVKFATATLHGQALTWWNSQVATLGLEVANGKPWTEVKMMMIVDFCPIEEVQRLEDELRHLKLRDMNIAAYTERFNELALLCPDAVPNEKKKVELYIKGLPEIIKGETTSSRPAMLNEAVRMAHTLMEQKIQAKNERIAKGNGSSNSIHENQ